MKRLRMALAFSQQALAETLHIDRSLISLAESGKPLGAETTRRMLDLYRPELNRLGITAEDLIRGERAA